MNGLLSLSTPALLRLADALASGRLLPPITPQRLAAWVSDGAREAVALELEALATAGAPAPALAKVLRLLASQREDGARQRPAAELVWSGPEVQGLWSRETASVLREIFASAEREVLLSTFVLDRGERARAVLRPLAERMEALPDLRVRLFVNVRRKPGRKDGDAVLLREFADEFRTELWPGRRLPEVFHDPRALDPAAGPRACLHAKCVVVDEELAFVSSANFTEAAQDRNIEAGVLLRDAGFSRALKAQFETLVEAGGLVRVGGIST